MSKEKGVLGIRDFDKLDEMAAVKDAIKISDEEGTARSRWMQVQYVKGQITGGQWEEVNGLTEMEIILSDKRTRWQRALT